MATLTVLPPHAAPSDRSVDPGRCRLPEEIYLDALAAWSVAPHAPAERTSARAAFQEVITRAATLVDIRTSAQRAAQGELPAMLDAVVVRREALATAVGPALGRPVKVIVVCADGEESVHAATQLRRLGFGDTTDVVGGVAAWLAAGMPVA